MSCRLFDDKYAVAELRKFVIEIEIGRTFEIVQYGKEAPLKTMPRDLCKTIGGVSMRAVHVPKAGSQWFTGVYLGGELLLSDGMNRMS
ncbi:hypothetical protein AK812_SmicGene36839 [Symbiodinium microadriaticum]|uniref:Uncharacterized protein n=1 Tax=Symbiodinium microadriaticum TaxID=2951 RepID=A0A1Q9CHU0_SYMMI|nr:hypothetical protein AK812_SmicGene36839 [Symbiodinium microadriaticum]